MTTGLDITFQILSKSRNEAALPWLIASLDDRQPQVQAGALQALLSRHSSEGHRQLLLRWHTLSESQLQIVDQNPGRLSGALRDGLLSSDATLNHNSCDAAVRLREYDLIPTLVRAAEDKSNPRAEHAANATLALAEHLQHELTSPRDYRNRRDPALVRQFVYGPLEQSVRQFGEHRRIALLEAFLLLVAKDDSLLKQILDDPNEVAYAPLIGTLTSSNRPGVIRVIVELMEVLHAPTTILHVATRRRDPAFLHQLFVHCTEKISANFKNNLRKVESWAWLKDGISILGNLQDEELCGAVRLATASAINRLRAFEVVKHALQHGGVRSRRAAAHALIDFKGSEANDMVLLALSDKDPDVQSQAVAQLRERGIPGSMHRLVDLLDSPHPTVQSAVHSALREFTFQRYLSAFEMLDKETRNLTGTLVKRVDNEAIVHLQAELTSMSRSRRIRGLELAVAMQATREVEEEIMKLSSDADHFIRAATAHALVRINSERTQRRLQELRLDRAIGVQEAVEEALAGFVWIPDPFAKLPASVNIHTSA